MNRRDLLKAVVAAPVAAMLPSPSWSDVPSTKGRRCEVLPNTQGIRLYRVGNRAGKGAHGFHYRTYLTVRPSPTGDYMDVPTSEKQVLCYTRFIDGRSVSVPLDPTI